MPDLDAAARHPARVLVDSTASTPVYLRALERGADYVLHSATKYLTGHHDVTLGAVACRNASDAERLRELRGRTGIVASPESAWLLHRGLATLDVRMRRHTESATAIAERLAAHEAVERVRYPGFGGLLSFDVAGGAAAARKVETGTRTIVERDEPRRRAVDPGDAPPLGGRARPREPRPAERRAGAARGALGRPECRAEQVDSTSDGGSTCAVGLAQATLNTSVPWREHVYSHPRPLEPAPLRPLGGTGLGRS